MTARTASYMFQMCESALTLEVEGPEEYVVREYSCSRGQSPSLFGPAASATVRQIYPRPVGFKRSFAGWLLKSTGRASSRHATAFPVRFESLGITGMGCREFHSATRLVRLALGAPIGFADCCHCSPCLRLRLGAIPPYKG